MNGRGPRRPRRLSGEESRLWSEVARFITPLRGRAVPVPASAPKEVVLAVESPKPATFARAPTLPTSAPYQAPAPRPLPADGLEHRTRKGLSRGSLRIDARIDLHGMYQADAHAALNGFLIRARAAGHLHVLVVTGKGGSNFDDAFSERGVLRRSVPHWLRSPSLSHVVLGFEEAGRRHGGAGALYVRLRRR